MRKFLSFSVVVCSLLFFVWCGATPSADTSPDEKLIGNDTTETQDVTNTVTREQCVELMAYAMKWTEYMGQKDMVKFYMWAEKLQILQEKYNVDDDIYDQVCNEFLVEESFMDEIQTRMWEIK